MDRVFRQCPSLFKMSAVFGPTFSSFTFNYWLRTREANQRMQQPIQVSKNPRRSEIDTEPRSIRAFGNSIPYNEKLLQQFKQHKELHPVPRQPKSLFSGRGKKYEVLLSSELLYFYFPCPQFWWNTQNTIPGVGPWVPSLFLTLESS